MPTFPDLEQFQELLDDTSWAFFVRRWRHLESIQKQTLLEIQEQMRSNTQAVRNWGYPDQIQRTVLELFAPLDRRVEARLGIRPTVLFGVFMKIIATTEARRLGQIRILGPIVKAKNPEQLFKAYGRVFPDRTEEIAAVQQVINRLYPGSTLEQIRDLILHHLSLSLSDVFTFSIDELLSMYDGTVDRAALPAVVERLALAFGALAESNPEHFFLGNPVWDKPFIQLDDDRFFTPVPGMLLSFGLDILESLVVGESDLQVPYTERRAAYLEEAAAQLFAGAFPDAQIFRGNMWPTKGANENDLLVIVDRVAVIVEAKAGSVSDSSGRGADMSLKSDIGELMVKASQQSSAFAAYLRANPARHRFETKQGNVNEIDTSNLKQFIRLNLTLRQVGNIYNRWPLLQEAGLIRSEVDMAPTMTLADLESIFEVLDGQIQKLHYLARRAELERHTNYSGGELDLLALYLETGFNIGDLEFESPSLLLDGKFQQLAPYFMRHETGRKVRKPRLVLSKWWSDMVKHTEKVKPLGWSRLGLALLTVPFEDQQRLGRAFESTKLIVRNYWKNKGHMDLNYVDTGPAQRRMAVAAYAYRNESAHNRRDKFQDVAAQVFDGVRADKLLLIGVNAEIDRSPYDDLIIAFRPVESFEEDKDEGAFGEQGR